MVDPEEGGAPALGLTWAAATIRAFAACGLRKIVITSVRGHDHASTARAARPSERPAWPSGNDLPGYTRDPGGFVVATAAALASRQAENILVVLAGEARAGPGPRPQRGLRELVQEMYLFDLKAPPPELGLGDWLEILSAGERTGELVARERGESFAIGFVRGSIRSLSCPASGRDLSLGGSALRARASERILRLIEARRPEFRFTDQSADPSPPARAARHPDPREAESSLDRLFRGPLRHHLRHPFLDRQLADSLTNTSFTNLKLLAASGGGVITPAERRPLEFLLTRISRGFGIVLIDADPVSPGGQTEVLAKLADTVLVIGNAGDLGSSDVSSAAEELRRGGAPLVGVLAHHAPADPPAQRFPAQRLRRRRT